MTQSLARPLCDSRAILVRFKGECSRETYSINAYTAHSIWPQSELDLVNVNAPLLHTNITDLQTYNVHTVLLLQSCGNNLLSFTVLSI